MSLDERLSARLASDFAPLALASAPSPFDEPTNALAKRCELAEFGIRQANVDRGFLDGCKLPAFGAMEERERREFTVKQQVWRTVKAWSAADEGREQWSLLAYRHTLHTFDAPPFWNLFNGLLFSNPSFSRALIVDYHESARETRPITIADRNLRSRIKANELFGLLLYCGSPEPVYVAATWVGPDTALHPTFLAQLPSDSDAALPSELALKLPPSIAHVARASFVPSFKHDDVSSIQTSLVINLGVDESETLGGEDRIELVLIPGCEGCGKTEAKLRCGACKGPLYCSAACQLACWKAHKAVCKRQRELFHDRDERPTQEHVHAAGCKHHH